MAAASVGRHHCTSIDSLLMCSSLVIRLTYLGLILGERDAGGDLKDERTTIECRIIMIGTDKVFFLWTVVEASIAFFCDALLTR